MESWGAIIALSGNSQRSFDFAQDDILKRVEMKKPCAGKRMADQSYSYLAPFGGITRIRFKGFVQDVSANLAPPQSCHEHKKTTWEVNAARDCAPCMRKLCKKQALPISR